jgi:hypothetical protein
MFEVKPSPGKGLGVFAAQFIKKGTMNFQEAPLIRGGPQWLEKEAAFMLMSKEKRDFMALYSQCNCHQSPCKETPLMKIFDANSYRPEGIGRDNAMVYKITSRINHACFANVTRRFNKARNIVIFSIEDIKKEDELTIDYLGAGAVPVPMRRAILQQQYGFHCRCRGCVNNKILPMDASLRELQDIWQQNIGEYPSREILGEETAEELAALARVDPWYQSLMFQISFADGLMRKMILDDWTHRRGNNVKDYFKNFCRLIKHNEFGLPMDAILMFLARFIPSVAQQIQGYLQEMNKVAQSQRT